MIWLVGDIQGCDGALSRLLDLCGFSPSRDRLVVLGDLVNRGPDSLAVLQRLAGLGGAATALLGNHDLHLLALAHGVRAPHRGDTLQALLAHPQRTAWIDWLRHRPLACEAAGWLCVHAGVPQPWTAQQTLDEAAQVQAQLRGPGFGDLLQQLYGNEPSRWSPSLHGAERWRFTINALTRMRFCQADGQLDFKVKESAAQAPTGLLPWFRLPGRAAAETAIAFGHWSTLGLLQEERLLGLDTGCVWGGCLSAVRVDGGRRELLQVVCPEAATPA